MGSGRLHFLAVTCAVSAAYFALSVLSWIVLPAGFASSGAFWPVAGVALAAVLLHGRAALAGVLLGAFASGLYILHIIGDSSPPVVQLQLAGANGVGAVLQAWIGALLIHKIAGFPRALHDDRAIIAMLVLGGPAACTISPSIASLAVWMFGMEQGSSDYLTAWLTWWAGHSAGVFVATPLTLALFNRPADAWIGRRARIVIPLTLLSALLLIALNSVLALEKRERVLQFQNRVSHFHRYFRADMESRVKLLMFAKALFDTSEIVTRQEFAAMAAILKPHSAELRGLDWIPRVTINEREEFEQQVRAAGFPHFQITEMLPSGEMARAAEREEYFPIDYVEPHAGNEAAHGFDVASREGARSTLYRARDSGRIVASRAVNLVKEPVDSLGIVMYAPIYRPGSNTATLEGRRSGFAGVVAVVMQIPALMQNFAARFDFEGVNMRLYEGSAGSGQRLLYARPRESASDREQAMIVSETVDLGGRTWELQFMPKPDLLAPLPSAITLVLVFGLFGACALFSTWLLTITGRHVRTEQAIAERTAHLRKSVRAIEQNPTMIMITDARAVVEYVNPKFTEVTGYAGSEMTGRSLAALLPVHGIARRRMAPIRGHMRRYGAWRGEVQSSTRAGEPIWMDVHVSPLRDERGQLTHYVVNLEDVTERRKLAEQLFHQARYDSLTGLINRYEFENALEGLIKSSRSADGKSAHALALMDLDQFKVVNDTCGHVAGDELLRQIGLLLKSNTRRTDILGRLGGDEFALLLENCPMEQAERIAENIRRAIEHYRFVWESKSFAIGVSIGVVAIEPGQCTLTELLQNADAACYAAKDEGRNHVHVYRQNDDQVARRHGEMQWVAEINAAIEGDHLFLVAQPIIATNVAARSRRGHYEVLVRLRKQDGSVVPPGAFLGAAERYNLSGRIDRWVVGNTLKWLSSFRDRPEGMPIMSINISGNSLGDREFLIYIMQQIEAYAIPADALCFELTETAAIGNLSNAIAFINTLKSIGCRFALDDFGSGLSSFAYLKNFPIDFLKIDGQFVKDIATDQIDFAMVRSINDVGHVMGKYTIAEYVENDEILSKLRIIGVDFVQGFGIGRPEPLDTLLLDN